MRHKYLFIQYIVVAILLASCSDSWLDLSPTTAKSTSSAFSSVKDFASVLNGAYSTMQNPYYYGGFMQWYPEVTAEDMCPVDVSARTSTAYRFLYTESNINSDFWSLPYDVILAANSILDNVNDIETDTEDEAEQLKDYKGQALALRALSLFDLTRLFGVPYQKNSGSSLGAVAVTTVLNPGDEPARNTVAECYNQIIADFEDAIELLPTTKTNGKINKYAAEALLARAYLYKGDNKNALKLAEDVIGSKAYSLLTTTNYVDAWKTGFSSESLFEIVQNSDDSGGHECIGYYLSPDGYAAMVLTDEYINLIKEDENDVRTSLLSDFIYNNTTIEDAYLLKYPGKDGATDVSLNNNIVIRLSEVYLIAAEAALKISDIDKARTYLNTLIENRNGTANYLSTDEVTSERIFRERRKELVCEGHRFFDAIRNGGTLTRDYEGFFGEISSIDWDYYRVVLPIPVDEINANSNMFQNDEY
jgi:hypothetical protein